MRRGWTRKVDYQVLTFGCVLVTAAIFLRVKIYREWPTILECGIYVGALMLLASCQPLRQLMNSLPRRHLQYLFCLAGMMLVAHIGSDPHKTFPFIPWAMYTARQPDPPVYFEYVGICADGREIQIPIHRVFRSQGRIITWRLSSRWRLMQSAEGVTDGKLRQRYHSLLTATVKRFNEQHPDDKVHRVRVVQCTVPKPAPGRTLEVTRRPLKEFAIR